MGEHSIAVLTHVGLFAFLAVSAYILLVGGEISFGQQAFFGIGAYVAGMGTAIAALPLGVALFLAVVFGSLAATGLGVVTLRLRGLYFSLATLAAAEAIRIFFELLTLRVRLADGRIAGPEGANGFGGIRYQFEHGFEPGEFLALIYGVLLAVLLGWYLCERGRFGVALRMAGADPILAAAFGVNVRRIKLVAVATAGAIAALGGGLFAHYSTFIEPRNFDVMLGVHATAYALIGGLGTPVGSLLGVGIDILVLEASRVFHGYRMIVFGGLVAVLLLVRPRGLLDEVSVHHLCAQVRRMLRCARSVWVSVGRPRFFGLLLCMPILLTQTLYPRPAYARETALAADIQCEPTDRALVYDCTIRLYEPHSGASVSGARFTVGADMPSMPMAHNVKPVVAEATDAPGTYRARLVLEMYGVWAVKLRILGPVRDQIVKKIDFSRMR